MSLMCHLLCAMRYLMYQPAMSDTANHASTRCQERIDGGGVQVINDLPPSTSVLPTTVTTSVQTTSAPRSSSSTTQADGSVILPTVQDTPSTSVHRDVGGPNVSQKPPQASGWMTCPSTGPHGIEYTYVDVAKTFDEAVHHCKSLGTGSKLATPHNAMENQCIYRTKASRTTTWIGIRSNIDRPNFNWTTVDDGNNILFHYWAGGEPNHGSTAQLCLTMWYSPKRNTYGSRWDNAECKEKVKFVCQRQIQVINDLPPSTSVLPTSVTTSVQTTSAPRSSSSTTQADGSVILPTVQDTPSTSVHRDVGGPNVSHKPPQASGWMTCPSTGPHGIEYTYVDVAKTFDEAVHHCKSLGTGSKLATPHNAMENQCIYRTKASRTTTWIGIRSNIDRPNFNWTTEDDGNNILFHYWAGGEPNHGSTAQLCLTMWYSPKRNTYGSRWDNAECKEKVKFVCQRQKPKSTTKGSNVSQQPTLNIEWKSCGPHGIEYTFVNQKTNFGEAVRHCKSLGKASKLAIPRNDAENQCINQAKPSKATNWIGIRSLVAHPLYKWLSVDDNQMIMYSKWAENEPSRPGLITQLCATMWYQPSHNTHGSKWDNVECKTKLYIVCQRPGRPESTDAPKPSSVRQPTEHNASLIGHSSVSRAPPNVSQKSTQASEPESTDAPKPSSVRQPTEHNASLIGHSSVSRAPPNVSQKSTQASAIGAAMTVLALVVAIVAVAVVCGRRKR
ncbi:macrophage mannose receptor 1-like [Sycon ciliatum]|uniref:macrophage mannose receptor 1-like n=1 Tax=Sycon ciliatum TaxID=27933 RepID=UPI0031F693CF